MSLRDIRSHLMGKGLPPAGSRQQMEERLYSAMLQEAKVGLFNELWLMRHYYVRWRSSASRCMGRSRVVRLISHPSAPASDACCCLSLRSCRALLNTPCAACPSFQQPRQEAAAEVEGAETAGDEDDVEWLESMGDLDLRTVLDDPNLTLAGARTGQAAGGGGGGQGEQGSGGVAAVPLC